MAIHLTDLRRGANERHPATLPENFVEQAWNITYDRSQLGARRNGSSNVVSAINAGANSATAMYVHTPDSTQANERLWAFCSDPVTPIFRFYTAAWAMTAPSVSPSDTFSFDRDVTFASLHGKLFIGCASSANSRLHVYDGTNIRRAGLAPPAAAPTAANTGAGTIAGTRYYRVRYAVLSGSTVLLRSEASAVLTFTPSGAGAAVRVTKPAAINEGETHWELEESIDNANFYRIATTVVGTTTYDDATAYSSVSTAGTLSATAGDYTVPENARYLVVDRDRLVGFGNFADATKDSDMTWTVTGSDTTGVGNDERVPTATQNRLRIDGARGGGITGAISYDTQILAFKRKGVYLISHTRNRIGAYTFDPIATTFGAVGGSVCEGVDAEGRGAVYFLDEVLGPMRYGARGFEQLAPHQAATFRSYFIHSAAITASTRAANSVYLPKRREVHFNLAQASSTVSTQWPTLTMVYNVETGGVSWTFRSGDTNRLNGRLIYCSVMWQNEVYVGSNNGANGSIAQIDVEGTTQDFGSLNYRSWVRTKAFSADTSSLKDRLQCMGAVLGARPATGVSVTVSAIRDHGKEIVSSTALLTPNAASNESGADERFVTVPLDSLSLSEATVLQFELGDSAAVNVAQWSLEQFSAGIERAGANVAGR